MEIRFLDAKDLREKTDDELKQILVDCSDDLMHFRLQTATGVVDNVKIAQVARRDVARVKTVLNERAREAQSGDGE